MGRNRTLGSPYEQQLVATNFTTESHIDRYIVIGPGPVVTATLDPNAFNGDQVTLLNAPDVAGSVNVVPSPGQVLVGPSTVSVPGDSILLTFLDIPGSGLPAVWTAQYQSSSASAGGGAVLVQTTTLTLADLQAAGAVSDTGFDVVAALPASARILNAEAQVAAALAGPGLASAFGYLGPGVNYTVLGPATAADIELTHIGFFASDLVGKDVYATEGGLTPSFRITLTGATFAALTAGEVIINIFYAVVP